MATTTKQEALDIMDKTQAAAFLGISKRQLDYLRTRAELPFYRLGNLIRFKRDRLEKWLESQEQTGNGPQCYKEAVCNE